MSSSSSSSSSSSPLEQKTPSPWPMLLGSSAAGMVARATCHPLDTCKAILQVQSRSINNNNVKKGIVSSSSTTTSTSSYMNFSQVVKQWTGKANESKGLDLVWRTFALIEQIKPKYWIVENVKGLGEFLPPPADIVRYGKNKQCKEAWLWSNIGKLALFPQMISRKTSRKTFKSGDPVLAEIPGELSREVAKCCNVKL